MWWWPHSLPKSCAKMSLDTGGPWLTSCCPSTLAMHLDKYSQSSESAWIATGESVMREPPLRAPSALLQLGVRAQALSPELHSDSKRASCE